MSATGNAPILCLRRYQDTDIPTLLGVLILFVISDFFSNCSFMA